MNTIFAGLLAGLVLALLFLVYMLVRGHTLVAFFREQDDSLRGLSDGALFSIFIGGFVAIVALSMGLGARSIAANLIAGYYIRTLFKEGQDVELCGVKGKITRINNINVVLKTKSGELIVPNNKIIEKGSLKEVKTNKS